MAILRPRCDAGAGAFVRFIKVPSGTFSRAAAGAFAPGVAASPLKRKCNVLMKRRFFICSSVVSALVMAIGCSQKLNSPAAGEATAVPVPQFSAKNGLLLPDQTRQSLGLKLIEVTERELGSIL